MSRDLEVVVYGATGYTGRLVAEYLVSAPSAKGLRWGLAGRDRQKLEALRAELGRPELELLVADADDDAALSALAARTRVVCTTAGPYARYGDRLIAACVDEGTHACDLAGEPLWIRRTIEQHHARAQARGARIVHSCGFDSIPSDLGVFMLDEALRARGRQLARVDAFFGESKGSLSGGTYASMFNNLDEAGADPALRRQLADPYVFVPNGSGPDRRDLGGVGYDGRLRRFTAPFPMAPINAPTVRRSNALLGYRYGHDFRYTEKMSLFPGAKGLFVATAVTAGLGAFWGALKVPPLRRLIARRLPKPGEGPSAEERAAGYFVVRYAAEALPDGEPLTLYGRCEDRRDPGYGSTAVMLAESALCLARDPLDRPAGVLTPASAMGAPLLARLRAAGFRWEVTDQPS
jgi:short subunit dehydrogenase-like uncharacterized protein